jgi:hypothetical protein
MWRENVEIVRLTFAAFQAGDEKRATFPIPFARSCS